MPVVMIDGNIIITPKNKLCFTQLNTNQLTISLFIVDVDIYLNK